LFLHNAGFITRKLIRKTLLLAMQVLKSGVHIGQLLFDDKFAWRAGVGALLKSFAQLSLDVPPERSRRRGGPAFPPSGLQRGCKLVFLCLKFRDPSQDGRVIFLKSIPRVFFRWVERPFQGDRHHSRGHKDGSLPLAAG